MKFHALKRALAPLYKQRDPAHQLEHGERMARCVDLWLDALGSARAEVDHDFALTLAYTATVREPIIRDMQIRGSIEACLVEEGWTQLRTRELVRALERVMTKPSTTEEQLVSDAATVQHLGLLGFASALMSTGAAQGKVDGALDAMQKALSRRLYTRVGQKTAGPLRTELRDLAAKLRGLTGG